MIDRLTKSDWIDEGLRTLMAKGANALKAVPLAERLKVSRGSFYWHFRDMADFRGQLLQAWRERATDQVIGEVEAEEPGPGRLKGLMKRAFSEDRRLDRAIRAWAQEDKAVAAAVAAVDAGRIAYIAKLLAVSGVEKRKAARRAAFLYWAYLGQSAVLAPGHAAMPPAAIDDLSAMFER